jgi:hypothetical protein
MLKTQQAAADAVRAQEKADQDAPRAQEKADQDAARAQEKIDEDAARAQERAIRQQENLDQQNLFRQLIAAIPAAAAPGALAAPAAVASTKLLKRQIKPFKGDVLEWTAFWEGYNAAVHESAIPAVQKFGADRRKLHRRSDPPEGDVRQIGRPDRGSHPQIGHAATSERRS